MSAAAADWRSLLGRPGVLLVLRGDHPARPPAEEPGAASPEPGGHGLEPFLSLDEAGQVTAYNGHVDLGTGIGTALAQIVAEELDVGLDKVRVVLGHTGQVPDQGGTIASETIQVTAIPLRRAAAQARLHLIGLATERLAVPAADLVTQDGLVRVAEGNRSVAYAELIAGRHIRLALDETVAVKPVGAYRIVGHSVARHDIPAKATGRFTYVHDVRVPGMLHGRLVRPPYAGLDHGPFVGRSLIGVDRGSVAHIPGVRAVVVEGDFIGIVAEREEQAAAAAAALKTSWRDWGPGPDLSAPEQALRQHPSTPRVLLDRGDVDAAVAGAAVPMRRSYVWPYQMHASIGPSCAVADVRDGSATVWSGTQNPLMLRSDLARLLRLGEAAIAVVRLEAAGCYGRNGADDVSLDAALLSRAVGAPVRVQLTRAEEHAWEPKGAAQVMDVAGGLREDGTPAAYDFATRYPSNAAPSLALLLTGILEPVPDVLRMGDRTAIPPYAYPHARVTVHDMAPIARASWLRGVSALPNSFAHESFVDELASEAGQDPVAYRLHHLDDERAASLIRSVADRAGWVPHGEPRTLPAEGDWLRGRGFAYATYVHGTFPGTAAASAAWVADVSVHRTTGEVAVTRVVVGQDAGLMINPAGVRHQIHGNVIQSVSRTLTEEVAFEGGLAASRDWGTYPILRFPELPAIDVLMTDRPEAPPLGVGESATVPSAAAIANAIFDATGIRFREPPFTPERVRAALNPLPPPSAPAPRRGKGGGAAGRFGLGLLTGGLGAVLGLVALAIPSRGAIDLIARPDPGAFAAATIERGRLAAAAGDCTVCHGDDLAGGRGIATPFGTVYASNISPDPVAGIGAWSYTAFDRAMRQGVSRDGHNLYPAHPYPSFGRAAEADIQALYAWAMAQPAVAHRPPATALPAPFGARSLMRVWNALFLRGRPAEARAADDPAWIRGRELVEGLGHCSACHSPRNLLGAERGGALHLGGGAADGWDAPALSSLSDAPVAWTEDAFFAYLSTGHHADHGVAAGPMAAVVTELAALPEADRRAMARYLASLVGEQPVGRTAEALLARTASEPAGAPAAGRRIYGGACAACHEPDGPTLFGARPLMALNTSLHAARPDNLIQVILNGIMTPAHPALGTMPGFAAVYSDAQTADLVRYMRARFAPDRQGWDDVEAAVARIRAAAGPHG